MRVLTIDNDLGRIALKGLHPPSPETWVSKGQDSGPRREFKLVRFLLVCLAPEVNLMHLRDTYHAIEYIFSQESLDIPR